MSDADLSAMHVWARSRFPLGTAVTLLHIGIDESAVVSGHGDTSPSISRIGVGFAATGRGAFRHHPPAPAELENAIAAVEDEVMRLAARLPRSSALVAVGGAMGDIARAAGESPEGDVSLTLAMWNCYSNGSRRSRWGVRLHRVACLRARLSLRPC